MENIKNDINRFCTSNIRHSLNNYFRHSLKTFFSENETFQVQLLLEVLRVLKRVSFLIVCLT